MLIRLTPLALRLAPRLPWLLLGLWLAGAVLVWAAGWPLRGRHAALAAGASVALLVLVGVWARWQRERWIREAPLPQFLRRQLRASYPHWSSKDLDLVERGLRQFFLACLRSRGQFVAMPSKAVDALWHAFILHTQAYDAWCRCALGRFLHHTPAEALGTRAQHNDGLRRAWFWACRDESIHPRQPSRLPLLFALDAKLGLEGGFHYLPDCDDIARKSAAGGSDGMTYCGTHFSDPGGASGSAEDFGGMDSADGNGGNGGNDGASDGGDGGGCGGGGD